MYKTVVSTRFTGYLMVYTEERGFIAKIIISPHYSAGFDHQGLVLASPSRTLKSGQYKKGKAQWSRLYPI